MAPPPAIVPGPAPLILATDVDHAPGALPTVVARDAPVGFETDRLLSPRSVARATVGMTSGGVVVFGRLSYDPARRRSTFTPNPGSMFAGTAYQFVIRETLLAWDGAPLGTAQTRSFVTSTDVFAPPSPPTSPTLSHDVAPILAARCATAGCHVGTDPVMGLDLSTAAGLERTAVGVIARERPANSLGASMRTDPQWGALDRIDPGIGPQLGDPAYSYLVYKILGDGPIEGDRMPPPPLAPLSDEEIRTVSDWIARGAPND